MARWLRRLIWTVLAGGALLGAASRADAQPIGADDDEPVGSLEPADADESFGGGDVSLALGWRDSEERDEWTGGLVVSFPWNDVVSRAPSGATTPVARSAPRHDAAAAPSRAASVRSAPTTSSSLRSPAHRIPLSGRERREAVEAAVRISGLLPVAARLITATRRARWSAALPELRLRATRTVTESASLSPTEYDPLRQTATGGTTLWIEGRATWRLERLVFAPEEVGLARLEQALRLEQERLARRVVDLLDRWQRAVLDLRDPGASFRECQDAYARASLNFSEADRITGGWMNRHVSVAVPPSEASCLPEPSPDAQ